MKLVRRVLGALGAAALATGGLAVVAPTKAGAYDAKVWDRVAACESSNRWHINTGNGYYGGLQFSPTTWKEFGGTTYASQAHKASKAEQIAIARRVLSVQGPGAWPVCSKKAGLTKSNGGADRNAKPGGGSTPAPKPPAPKPGDSKTVTVKSGDTLYSLASHHQVPGGWQAIVKANDLKDPNLIRIGQKLVLPQ